MTAKLKNRLKQMHFQKQRSRRNEVETTPDDKYYEELYSQKVNELLGIKDENIHGITRGSLRPQHI